MSIHQTFNFSSLSFFTPSLISNTRSSFLMESGKVASFIFHCYQYNLTHICLCRMQINLIKFTGHISTTLHNCTLASICPRPAPAEADAPLTSLGGSGDSRAVTMMTLFQTMPQIPTSPTCPAIIQYKYPGCERICHDREGSVFIFSRFGDLPDCLILSAYKVIEQKQSVKKTLVLISKIMKLNKWSELNYFG